MKNAFLSLIIATISVTTLLRGETVADLKSWTIDAAVQMDPTKPGPDGKPSIEMPPLSKATLKLRDEDGSGKLTLFVYDDGTVAAPDQKKSAGPRWGLVQKNGRVLVGGIMYAHFFKPNGSLAVIETDGTQKAAWEGPKFVGLRDKTGWVKWEFTYDPDHGVQITVNDQPCATKIFRLEHHAGNRI